MTALEREVRDRVARGEPLEPLTIIGSYRLHLDDPEQPAQAAAPAYPAEKVPGATVWSPPLEPFEWRGWPIDGEWIGRK